MSTTIATTSLIISLNAQTIARQTACKLQESTYNAATATINQMQEYAACVQLLHPSEITGSTSLLLKVLIVLCFIGGGVGAYRGYKDYAKIDDAIMGGLLGVALSIVGAFSLLAMYEAVKFLFS